MSLDGLTDPEVTASREAHGANEVKANQTPEWKKVRSLEHSFSISLNVHYILQIGMCNMPLLCPFSHDLKTV